MSFSSLFSKNLRAYDNIEESKKNQLYKVDSNLFDYVNSVKPDSEKISVRVTDQEHNLLVGIMPEID